MQSTLKFEQLIYLLASVVRRLNDKPKKAKKKPTILNLCATCQCLLTKFVKVDNFFSV